MNEASLGEESSATPLLNLALESWRFANLAGRLVLRLEPSEQKRYVNQFDWFRSQVDKALNAIEAKLVDLTGQEFESGMAVKALNLDDFGPDDKLQVEQMIEPVVIGKDGVLRMGTVTLKRME